MSKRALVLGAGGFIGSHLVNRLKKDGYRVTGVDLKRPEFSSSGADHFFVGDLRSKSFVYEVCSSDYDEVYQLAADMGGAGYIFTGEHDADVMHNSAMINLNVSEFYSKNIMWRSPKIFYSSSACIYPAHNQEDPDNPICSEDSAYPAAPDSEYGWEKLFSERMYLAYARNYGLDVRIARFHNIFGPEGTWAGGKEKAPAAMCRKVAEAEDGGEIEVWGDGDQTRSFLYIDDCLDGVQKLMASDFQGPVNIGSEEMVSINQLAKLTIKASGKNLSIKNVDGPLGVRGRSSDNRLIKETIGWEPPTVEVHPVYGVISPLWDGLVKTYAWIDERVHLKRQAERV